MSSDEQTVYDVEATVKLDGLKINVTAEYKTYYGSVDDVVDCVRDKLRRKIDDLPEENFKISFKKRKLDREGKLKKSKVYNVGGIVEVSPMDRA
jgi:ribosome-associated translation inhibitor RaiA